MHFQIYIPSSSLPSPGSVQSPPETLALVGLADLAANASVQSVVSGPKVDGVDLGPGQVFTWDLRSSTYFGENADWVPAVPSGDLPEKRYWVGIHRNSRPTPAELQKPNLFHGPRVTLGDGNLWTVPAGGRLPHVYKLNGSGKYQSQIREEFRAFFEKTWEWYKKLLEIDPEQETVSVTADWCQYCVEALSMNYRLVPELVSYLELIGSENLWSIAIGTVEGLEIREVSDDLQKKREQTIPA